MKTAVLLTTCFLGLAASAQNLVQNGGYEEYTTCPPTFSFIEYAVGWVRYRGSPDFFHACNTGVSAGVPYNVLGFQYPAAGDGYSGIITYDDQNPYVREIMGTELVEPLMVGVPVYLSFKVAVGGFGSFDGGSALYTCRGVGLKFFLDIPSDPFEWLDYLYPNSAALALTQVPTDTAIWYTVQGMYIPDSAYTHLLIANFFADSLSNPTILDSTGFANTYYAYAFIDEVCVAYDPAVCGIAQGIAEGRAERTARVSNPFSQELNLWLPSATHGPLRIELYDPFGRLVWQRHEVTSATHLFLELPELPEGLFILEISDKQGPYSPLTVVHQSP